jgi:carbonic anhydrase
MLEYKQIFENNRKWLAEKNRTNSEFFDQLSEGQNPDYLFIGCSDSRVTAEAIMGAKPGEVFVHRNIANLVPNNDNSSASVIEYAVKHLGVKQIVVCGHYLCGGVKAAMQSVDLGILNPWLRNIRDVYRLHKTELNAITDETARYNRLVELNVQEQCINIIKMAVWQKRYLNEGFPEVHGWVFDIQTGKLIDLEIDFNKELQHIREIYDLGTSTENL